MNEQDIKQRVLAQIERGEVSMRSRAYFLAKVAVLAALALAAAALSVFVVSFALFSLHESGEQFLLGFGTRGVVTFLTLFPWLALALLIALLITIEFALRRFKFGYRMPVLPALAAILTGALMLGLLVSLTPFHASLLDQAERGALPLLDSLYGEIYASHHEVGVYRGVVTDVDDDRFVIMHDDFDQDADDGVWTILVPTGLSTRALKVGDRVFVAGVEVASGTVEAYGTQEYER